MGATFYFPSRFSFFYAAITNEKLGKNFVTTFYYNSSWPVAGQAEGGPVEGGVEGLQFCFCIFIICIAVKGEVGGRQAELYFSFLFLGIVLYFGGKGKSLFFSCRFHVALCMPGRTGRAGRGSQHCVAYFQAQQRTERERER